MFGQSALRDELQSLKVNLSRVLNTTGEELLNSSKTRADALADQIRVALSDFGEVLAQEESRFAIPISDRPVASLASTFALGVIVGLVLRRH